MRGNIDIVLDEEETEDGRIYWKVESGKHSIDLRQIKESDDDTRDTYLLSKYCSTLEYALKTYIDERMKRLDVDSLSDLDDGLDDLKEHIEDVKDIIEKCESIDVEFREV